MKIALLLPALAAFQTFAEISNCTCFTVTSKGKSTDKVLLAPSVSIDLNGLNGPDIDPVSPVLLPEQHEKRTGWAKCSPQSTPVMAMKSAIPSSVTQISTSR
jgi:hypothetical protein